MSPLLKTILAAAYEGIIKPSVADTVASVAHFGVEELRREAHFSIERHRRMALAPQRAHAFAAMRDEHRARMAALDLEAGERNFAEHFRSGFSRETFTSFLDGLNQRIADL